MQYTAQDITPEIVNKLKAKIRQCIKIAETVFKRKFYMPKFDFSLSGNAAGIACGHDNVIRINPTLLIENLDDFVNQTIVHEYAHIVTDTMYPTGYKERKKRSKRIPHHGSGWKYVMELFGAPPIVYHNYTVEPSVRSARQRFKHTCSVCGGEYDLTVHQAAAVRARSNSMFHAKCGSSSKFIPCDPTVIPLTKFEKCEQLYLTFRTATRAEVLALFTTHAGTSPASGTSYYSKLRKKYDR